MKSSLKYYLATLIACAFILNSCKKKDSTPPATIDTPAVTAVGIPVGTLSTATIDATGGTVTSADGILEIIFPAGAVSTATVINIQPIINFCIGGLGLAYRIGPSGVAFSSSVTIRFHYATLDLSETNQIATSIAYQLADHTWKGYGQSTVDTLNKTVSYDVNKFGEFRVKDTGNKEQRITSYSENDIAFIELFKIEPAQKTVSTGNTVEVKVYINCNPSRINDPAYPVLNWNLLAHHYISSWVVNNIPNGNSTIGTLFSQTDFAWANYHAPSVKPTPNTVRVNANINLIIVGGTFSLLSNITIVDGDKYKLTLSRDYTGTSTTSPWCVLGDASQGGYKDKGTFFITVIADTVFLNTIQNTTPAITFVSAPPCDCINMSFPNGSIVEYNDIHGTVSGSSLYYVIAYTFNGTTDTYQCSPSPPATITGVSYPGQIENGFLNLPADSAVYPTVNGTIEVKRMP